MRFQIEAIVCIQKLSPRVVPESTAEAMRLEFSHSSTIPALVITVQYIEWGPLGRIKRDPSGEKGSRLEGY